jgi:hypothetical protein
MDILREKQRARGAHRACGGGGGGGGSTAAQNYTAIQQIQLSREQLDWAKQMYAQEQPAREEASRVANEVAGVQVDAMRQQMNFAQQSRDDYEQLYRPLEQKIVKEADEYDTPERRAAESAKAVASVEQQLNIQRDATMREQERSGVNPASMRTAGLQASMDLNAAKLKAGAGTAAGQAVEAQGYARRMDAANLGRNIASSQGTQAALAASMGTQGVANATTGLNNLTSGTQQLTQAYGTAINGMGAAGNTFGSLAGRDAASKAAKDKNTQEGVAAAASIAAMFFM